ncbi:MAG: hypothetical protein AAF517_09960 [Planctomycetota bacterium]
MSEAIFSCVRDTEWKLRRLEPEEMTLEESFLSIIGAEDGGGES